MGAQPTAWIAALRSMTETGMFVISLRTAFVLDFLHKKVATGNSPVTLIQRNPFELLERRPVNYFGEVSSAEAGAVPTGSWVFDPVCACVGYLPIYAQWFDSRNGDIMAWYQVSGAPGPGDELMLV